MTTALPMTENITHQLLAYECAAADLPPSPLLATLLVFEKLRASISKLTGTGGYVSLLNRSISMAKAKASSLNMLRIQNDGTLQLNDEFQESFHLLISESAGVILLTQFLNLMITFIGETLTVNLVHEVWPNVAFDIVHTIGGKKS